MNNADTIRLLVLGDVHDQHAAVREVLELAEPHAPDAVLCVGDLTACLPGGTDPNGVYPAFDRSVQALADLIREHFPGVPYFMVPGNHDLPRLRVPENIDNRVVTVNGVSIIGIGGAGPAIFGLPYEWSENEIERRLRHLVGLRFPDGIVLCHTPPLASGLDRTAHGYDAGSARVADWCQRSCGLFLCGHIHEAVGCRQLTPSMAALNAGSFGRPHARPMMVLVDFPRAGGTIKCSFTEAASGTGFSTQLQWQPVRENADGLATR